MTTARSSRVVRFGRRVAERWAEIDDAQRRMFEIRIGVRQPTRRETGARREHAARRTASAETEPRGARPRYDSHAAELMC